MKQLQYIGTFLFGVAAILTVLYSPAFFGKPPSLPGYPPDALDALKDAQREARSFKDQLDSAKRQLDAASEARRKTESELREKDSEISQLRTALRKGDKVTAPPPGLEEASRQSALEEEARRRAALAAQKQFEEKKKREAEAVEEEARRRAAFAGQTAYVSRILRVEAVDVRRFANEIEITLLFTNLSNQSIWWTAGYTSRAITDRGYQYGFQTSFKDATNLVPGVPVRISYTFTGSDPTAQRVSVILTQSSVYKPEPDIVVRNIPLL